jgi:AmmeMemoRadiSam system protein A
MLSEDERHDLLRLARHALEARVRRHPSPGLSGATAPPVAGGAFVTVHCRGELRGCLGRLEVEGSLPETIRALAVAVADSDPRFEPIQPDELAAVDIEISVLTPEREIRDPSAIEVGRHGLIVEQGGRRGLLLPQVAGEHGWDRETFLKQTCLKAGLPPDAWEHGARLLVFEAEVFGEHRDDNY